MKVFRYFLTFFIGVTIGGLITTTYISLRDFMLPQPWIVIEVKNQSSQDIVEIYVKNEFGSIRHAGVSKSSEILLPVSQVGEGNYTIKFTMEDGTVCGSEVGYVESGYKTTEWITDRGAINDMYKNLGYEPNKCM